MKTEMKLMFFTALILCNHALSIRDFDLAESNNIQPDPTEYAAVARYVVHKSGDGILL